MMNSYSAISHDVTIGDLLRLALPLKTHVLAAVGDMRRSVFWVTLLTTWHDLANQVKHGDLVLIPGALQRQAGETKLKEGLAAMAESAAVAVLMFDRVSERVAATAAELSLPLLIVPAETSLRETHRSVVSLLIDKQSATTERGMQLYRRLSEMSREGLGLAAMTDVIANLTGKAAVVQDKRLEIQAASVPSSSTLDMQVLLEVLCEREQLPAVLRNRKAAAKARQSYWQQLLPIENMGRLISPIVSGDRARGYLSVVGEADKLDLLDSLAVEHGAAACALEMAKAKAMSEVKKSLRGDFLEGLLAGTLPQKEIERLAGRLDHDTAVPHAVITLSWDGTETPSLRRLETTVNWLLANHIRRALVHVQGDQHVCVFQALQDENDMESAHELIRRLSEQLKMEFPDSQLIGGISGPAESLSDWPRVYQEAIRSMQLGRRLKLKHVVDFTSLGVYRLLGHLEGVPAVRDFTERVIGPLVGYDRQHHSNLVQTIDAYFEHHGNISQTAESLFIHRNTLLYRLERIQELTDHDLDQPNMRLALHLALKFWQLHSDR